MMLNKYNPKNNQERENAIKEIIQEIVLAGLSRSDFFSKAAFYGGTCLRIFHGLNRFSEDLDFALITKDKSFRMEDYFQYITRELLSYGINMEISIKNKDEEKEIQTAFVKGNTMMLLMQFFPKDEETSRAMGNQLIKIKFEIDVNNPDGGKTEDKYQLLPSPYKITIFDEATLFAGKIHALLCREYKKRIKGRDYYDYLFYCGKQTKFNLTYLENKLKNTGKLSDSEHLTKEMVKSMLLNKFQNVDYELMKEDVINFISNPASLDVWSQELFISTLEGLDCI